MCLLFALPEVVTGILTFVASIAGPVAGIVTAVVFAVRRERKKALARVESEPPAAPAPTLPLQSGVWFADPSVTGKIHEANVSLARSEWAVSELRDEMAAVRRDMAAVADDQRKTAAELVRTQTQLTSAEAKATSAERVAAEWRAEADRLERELAACEARSKALLDELVQRKREQGSTHSTTPDAVITPLRPPRRSP